MILGIIFAGLSLGWFVIWMDVHGTFSHHCGRHLENYVEEHADETRPFRQIGGQY